MANENDEHESKREKFHDFENGFQWTNLIQAMFEEKEVWHIVDEFFAEPIIAA